MIYAVVIVFSLQIITVILHDYELHRVCPFFGGEYNNNHNTKYASGGRGLPVVELPSCPGRFVLKGTFGFVPRPHAARARHNVRTALGAFKILGGARGGGAWLGAEAILEGDFEVTTETVQYPSAHKNNV